MQRANRSPWGRTSVEALVVVASILLAFAIDAWWDGRSAAELRTATLEGLLADFEGAHSYLSAIIDSNERSIASHQFLLEVLRHQAGSTRFQVPDTVLLAALGSPTYNPPRASVEMALASGRLSTLQDEPIRRLLARWLQDVDDTAEDELAASDVVADKVVPLLAASADLADILPYQESWVFDQVPDEVASRSRTIETNGELVSLLAVRMAHTQMALRGLSQLLQAQEEIADTLRSVLRSR